jgi:hypothetical protein
MAIRCTTSSTSMNMDLPQTYLGTIFLVTSNKLHLFLSSPPATSATIISVHNTHDKRWSEPGHMHPYFRLFSASNIKRESTIWADRGQRSQERFVRCLPKRSTMPSSPARCSRLDSLGCWTAYTFISSMPVRCNGEKVQYAATCNREKNAWFLQFHILFV